MADKFCGKADVLDQAPEFLNESELGTIDDAAFDRIIEEGTLKVKSILDSRYDVSLFVGNDPSQVPLSVRWMTAVKSAIIGLVRYQLGNNERSKDLTGSWRFYVNRAVNGSLLADDDTLIATSAAGASVGDPLSTPTELEPIYRIGSRYGVDDATIETTASSDIEAT